MRLLVVLCVSSGALTSCGSGPSDVNRAPLVVFLESNRRRLTAEDEVPTFILYADGLVIYRSRCVRSTLWGHVEKGDSEYKSVLLTAEEKADLLTGAFGDGVRAFDALRPHYTSSGISDMPTNTILHWLEGEPRESSVYGWLRKGKEQDRDPTPAPFLRAFDVLSTYRSAGAIPWMPESVAVLAWDGWARAYREASVPWPKGWPDLRHPSTRKIDGKCYRICLKADALPELRSLISGALVEGGAMIRPFDIGGELLAVDYLYVFPGEHQWMRREESEQGSDSE